MTIFPACKIIEKDGRLGLDVSSRYGDEWKDALSKFKKGWVQVVLKRPEKPATEAQNKAFHALIGLYYKSGIHSYESYDELRNTVKKRYGVTHEVKVDGEMYLFLLSWSKYTLKDRMRCIDGLKSEMEQVGILGSKSAGEYLEIINGMQGVK